MLKIRALLLAAMVAALACVAVPASAGASLGVPYGGEALADGLWNETWAPWALSGGNNGCKPSAAHPYPVVLVHATFADEGSNWVTLAPLLANAGYCVYGFNYGETILSGLFGNIDGLGDISHSGEELRSFVNKVLSQTGAAKVDLVGHSQGGLMPNYYLKYLGGAAKVHTFIGMSPSNHGTTLSGVVGLIQNFPFASLTIGVFLEVFGAPSLPQQEVGSAFEKKTFEGGDTVAGPRYVVIQTTHDEVVTPYANAFLSGPAVTNITIQSQCPGDPVGHIGMFEDSPVMQNILNQLSATPSQSFTATCTKYGWGL
ncbi:MAG TPA: alpha/beta fold hydrolase [Solirubrobacteraceae bacterium]|jgi:triacylglycerol esterase/lipase EstA (alpha/beta hydrolase family)